MTLKNWIQPRKTARTDPLMPSLGQDMPWSIAASAGIAADEVVV